MKWDELKAQLDAIPGHREAYAAEYPDDELSMAICRKRAACEMDQRTFAKLLGISVKALVRLESGNLGIRRLPTADEVRGILRESPGESQP